MAVPAFLMERKVEVLRGWPNDGARDNYETINSTENPTNGAIVIPTTAGAVTLNAVSGRGDSSSTGTAGGVVLKGPGDYTGGPSAGSSYAAVGKVEVLWGNAIIRTDSTLWKNAPSIGWAVTYRATGAGAALQFDQASNAADVKVGIVKNVQAAGTGSTAASYAVDVILF